MEPGPELPVVGMELPPCARLGGFFNRDNDLPLLCESESLALPPGTEVGFSFSLSPSLSPPPPFPSLPPVMDDACVVVGGAMSDLLRLGCWSSEACCCLLLPSPPPPPLADGDTTASPSQLPELLSLLTARVGGAITVVFSPPLPSLPPLPAPSVCLEANPGDAFPTLPVAEK